MAKDFFTARSTPTARLTALAAETRTMVFFEAPHRLADFLIDAADILGKDRAGVICRELTKPYEEVIRGTLSFLGDWAAGGVRGEVTLVVGGAEEQLTGVDDALEMVAARIADGEKLSTAVRSVADVTGANRKELYEAALAARKDKS